MTKSRAKDQFLYALLAVVFGAAAVIVLKDGVLGRIQTSKPRTVVEVLGAQTPDELMVELQKTVGDSEQAEMLQLKQEAQGL